MKASLYISLYETWLLCSDKFCFSWPLMRVWRLFNTWKGVSTCVSWAKLHMLGFLKRLPPLRALVFDSCCILNLPAIHSIMLCFYAFNWSSVLCTMLLMYRLVWEELLNLPINICCSSLLSCHTGLETNMKYDLYSIQHSRSVLLARVVGKLALLGNSEMLRRQFPACKNKVKKIMFLCCPTILQKLCSMCMLPSTRSLRLDRECYVLKFEWSECCRIKADIVIWVWQSVRVLPKWSLIPVLSLLKLGLSFCFEMVCFKLHFVMVI